MKQIIVELDDATARSLEQVSPARSRRRSEFIRMAIRKALWDLVERKTAEAYARAPDAAAEAYFDPRAWEAPREPRRRRRRGR